MVSVLRTAIVAVVVSAFTAGADLFYIDHKIGEATEAVVGPIEETVGTVTDTVESVAFEFAPTVDSLHDSAALPERAFQKQSFGGQR